MTCKDGYGGKKKKKKRSEKIVGSSGLWLGGGVGMVGRLASAPERFWVCFAEEGV